MPGVLNIAVALETLKQSIDFHLPLAVHNFYQKNSNKGLAGGTAERCYALTLEVHVSRYVSHDRGELWELAKDQSPPN